MTNTKLKILISGGGTGGHVFPAIAIADALMQRNPLNEILFVGARGRIEMEKVPAAGYRIEGLPVAGFQRRLTYKNITFFFKLAASMLKARRIVRSFNPDVAVGVGGYASGPVLKAAASMGVPTLLQEQNSFPGITNRILAKKARRICVAYPDLDQFFPPSRIVLTGNPVRRQLLKPVDRQTAFSELGLDPEKKTMLVIGGSLGARSINEGVMEGMDALLNSDDIQLIWQCGKYYYHQINEKLHKKASSNIKLEAFISRMDLAYTVADVVVSRAGAGTISELALLGKACILVPSPNVSEDHQTKNAMSLVNAGAAILVPDQESRHRLMPESLALLNDKNKRQQLQERIKIFAHPDSAEKIAEEIEKLSEPR